MLDLVKELEDKNIRISLKENNLEINFDGEIDSEILNKLRTNKEKLVYFLTKHSNVNKGIKSIGVLESYPISHAQKRLWIQSQIEEKSKAYHICNQIELNENFDINILEDSVFKVIKRHEILRTIFKLNEEGEIRQWILSDEELNFKVNHIDFRNEKEPYQKVKQYIQEDNEIAFDFENGPLLRISFLKLTDEHYILYYNMHHIITDGWSINILERDLFSYYQSFKSDVECDLKDLLIQYKDYATWQLSSIETGAYKSHRNFWRQQLSGDLPRLDLPSFKERPRVITYNGHILRTYLSPELTNKIKGFCNQNGGSLFMGLLTVLKILLNKYTSQQDIIMGTAVAGREDSDLEDQIGFYINTLVLRNEIDQEDSFFNFFEKVKKSTMEAFSHQIYPFDMLVSDLNLNWDTNRNSVFDSMITFHNTSDAKDNFQIDKDNFSTIVDLGSRKANFDFEFEFKETGDALSFVTSYNNDIYDFEMIERLINHFKILIAEVLQNPYNPIKNINYLSEEEKYQLLLAFNDTRVAHPEDKTIIDLFEEQVAKTPNSIALVFEDKELTYQELDDLSTQLSYSLREDYGI
ncbi:condensation domain-containing protein, partial [Flavobacterium sp. ZB4P13]|uniref:condensation domain-containing protein n=1 Tax=Flavobacterium sp. ZB4P13 TaxID=3401728 RepID=UPI003AACC248